MGDFRHTAVQRYAQLAATDGDNYGVTLTAAAAGSENTKGAWSQLIAAAPFRADGMVVSVSFHGAVLAADEFYLFDIGVGAANLEEPIIENLLHQADDSPSAGSMTHMTYVLPVPIPAGVRVAARTQASFAAAELRVQVHLIQGGFFRWLGGGGRATAYGVATATSRGTSVDPGATLDTKNAWAQLTASCNRVKWLAVAIGNQGNSAMGTARWRLDIGVGAAASEKIVIPDILVATSTQSDVVWPTTVCLPIDIPAGQRIAARAQCSITQATDRLIDVALMGVG